MNSAVALVIGHYVSASVRIQYFVGVLYITAALSLIRFLGFMWYLVRSVGLDAVLAAGADSGMADGRVDLPRRKALRPPSALKEQSGDDVPRLQALCVM